jgi:pentatricopeptide repeat protein
MDNLSTQTPNLGGLITILFMACSRCAWPEYALRKIESVRVYLNDRNILLDIKGYTSMLYAYGMAGQINSSFKILEEMLDSGMDLNVRVFNNLLNTCVRQQEYGFRFALKVRAELKFKHL